MSEKERLKRVIAHLEAQRKILGNDTVQAAWTVLHQRLAVLDNAELDVPLHEKRATVSPLIGRKAELGVVVRRIERITENQGRFVSIIGEAGIGKSRLIAEIRGQILGAGWGSQVQWLEASAVSRREEVSYWLFRQIVWQCAGINEQDNTVDVRPKLQARLAALFDDKTSEILPYLAAMIALDARDEFLEQVKYLNSEAMRRQVFLASRRLFERIAQAQPLVLVFEDLQWIDESSALLLQHLVPLIYRSPLPILAASRPVIEGPMATLLENVRAVYHDRYDEIRLARLSSHQSAKLAAILLNEKDLSSGIIEKIVEKAEGNPFFIEEIIRSLIDEGILQRDSSCNEGRLTADIETMSVPPTIHSAIRARVDLLDGRLKEVVKVAAVIGRRFLYRILLAIVETAGDLLEQLERLERLGLIVNDERASESTYMFNHDLVHETIYGTIDAMERKALHSQVGAVIERLFGERLEEFFSRKFLAVFS
jgi:predicted ATPase